MEKKTTKWFEVTTWHGWSDLGTAKSWFAKGFWTCMIIFSVSYMVAYVALLINQLNQEDRWTTDVFRHYRDSLQYPLVDICNYNRINYTKAITKWNLTDDLITYILHGFGNLRTLTTPPSEETMESYKQWKREHGNPTFTELVFDLGHDCESTLLFGVAKANFRPITCNDSRYILNSFYGKCMQFNFSQSQFGSVSLAGSYQPLSFVFDVGVNHYHSGLVNSFADAGLIVSVGYTISSMSEISVPSGFHSWIEMRNKASKLDPSSLVLLARPPCHQSGVKQFQVLPDDVEYSRLLCVHDCILSATWSKCGCIAELYSIGKFHNCEPYELDACLKQRNASGALQLIPSNCSANCPEACNTRTIDTSSSLAVFPNKQNLDKVQQLVSSKTGYNFSTDYLANGFSMVDIFFGSTHIEVAQWREMMKVDELLTAIGAQIGLCAGISVISIIQCIWYGIGYLITRLQSLQMKQKVDMPEETIVMNNADQADVGWPQLASKHTQTSLTLIDSSS